MTGRGLVYLDSSAIVKLVVAEAESGSLREFLRLRPLRVSCALARVEVIRAVRGQGDQAVVRARQALEGIQLLRIDDALLDAAAELNPMALRSLDALHIAAAHSFGDELEAIVTYDARMAEAATSVGLACDSPG